MHNDTAEFVNHESSNPTLEVSLEYFAKGHEPALEDSEFTYVSCFFDEERR